MYYNKRKAVTLYPDLYLDVENSNCTINYCYPKIDISEHDKKLYKFEYFAPKEINSLEDLYNLLNQLNDFSGKQILFQTKGSKKIYLLMIIFGIPACIIPPLGICSIIVGILGILGYIKKEYRLPKINISTNYTSQSGINVLNNIIKVLIKQKQLEMELLFGNTQGLNFYNKFNTEKLIYDKLNFDDGSKLLLFNYSASPFYSTRYEHETKSGAPDMRYLNNAVYRKIVCYRIELMVPGRIYSSDNFPVSDYDELIGQIEELKKSTTINEIKIGRNLNYTSNGGIVAHQ